MEDLTDEIETAEGEGTPSQASQEDKLKQSGEAIDDEELLSKTPKDEDEIEEDADEKSNTDSH